MFSAIRAAKRNNSSEINKLIVNDKTYVDGAVPDGFYDSLLGLKTLDQQKIQDQVSYHRYCEDYTNIMAICSSSSDIPMISLETSKSILKSVRPSVNDFHSITANHFLYAGEPGIIHSHLLLKTLITNISLIKVKEVNIVHATILFKGHLKDKTLASSYRTISCCPLVAKALDTYLRDLNIVTWNKDQAPTQFLGQGSSHELAAFLLTEVIQFSMYTLKQPLLTLY